MLTRFSKIQVYIYINEQRKRIASLILGVLNARIYRAKYKYKKESITSYSSFTLKAIIRLGVAHEKIAFMSVQI